MTPQAAELSAEELARYSRQVILPMIGRDGQERLKRSRVLIIGLGGLGSPASLYLAAAGVGHLGLVDFDQVEIHNLHRQIVHGTGRIGARKTASARERLKDLNPHVEITEHLEGLRPENAEELMADYDLVLDGTDNFPARYLANDAAFFAGKPLVHGSVFQYEGQASVFTPGVEGPCYRCLFPEMPPPGTVPNCAEAGVFGALVGIMGSLQAMEAIKWLSGVGESLRGRLLVYNALQGRMRELKLKRDPECPLCGNRPSITAIHSTNYIWACEPDSPAEDTLMANTDIPAEVSLDEARELKAQGAVFLDVREDFEREIASIGDSRHIPLGQIPQSADSLSKDETLVVYCHHGGRSLRAVQFLRDQGFPRATSMKGGIDIWAQEVEPGMQRY